MLIFGAQHWSKGKEELRGSQKSPSFASASVFWLPFSSESPTSSPRSISVTDTAQAYTSQCQSSPSPLGVHLGHWIMCQGFWLLEPEPERCCAISSSPTNTDSQPQMAPNLSSQDHKGKKSFQIKKLKLATKVPHGSNL